MLQPTPKTRGIPTHDDCINGHQWLTINFQRRNEFPLYTLASVRFLSCMENHMDHNLRLWVITVDGKGFATFRCASRRPAVLSTSY